MLKRTPDFRERIELRGSSGASADNCTVPAQKTPRIDHYENFPVASWLCPPRLRAPIVAIYRFARTADDIADEGTARAGDRLAALAAYRLELGQAMRQATGEARRTLSQPAPIASPVGTTTRQSQNTQYRWPEVFAPLEAAVRAFGIAEAPLAALLSAFVQDVENTRDAVGYANRTELLDYCARSANPIGHLLLHLYGLREASEPDAFKQSDAICSALQLINFWQDASVDLPRGRLYFPTDDCARHGLAPTDLFAAQRVRPGAVPSEVLHLVADEVAWARQLMKKGAPLARRLSGRIGWELRLVVQAGLCLLDKIERLDFDTLRQRPTIVRADLPRLLFKAWRM